MSNPNVAHIKLKKDVNFRATSKAKKNEGKIK